MDSSLVSFKDLTKRLVEANIENQQQVKLLQKEKEYIEQQYHLARTGNQRIQEQKTTITVT